MKLISLRPALASFYIVSALIVAAIALPLYRELMATEFELTVFYGLIMAFLLALLLDFLLTRQRPETIDIQREHEKSISLNVEQAIKITIKNLAERSIELKLIDDTPQDWRQLSPILHFKLSANEQQTQCYHIKASRRGAFNLQQVYVRHRSKFGLWQASWRYPLASQVNVFPDFSAISEVTGLNAGLNLTEAGLKKLNKRGTGMDFNQLRDYREGDSIRQIDWAATGRFNKPISREYQEEKNQNVTVLLDSGKRMCVQDDELSYFDNALNALILLSYTALKTGDQLSFMSFGEQTRWLSNIKGGKNVSQVLNHFFDLYPDTSASDYLAAAQTLMQKQHKRSLVLLVTCLRDEDFADLLEACKLLQRKHLVAVISITEPVYQNIAGEPVESFEQALSYSAASLLEQKIKKQLSLLQHQGVICFQVDTGALSARVVNTYLTVKKSGQL